MQFRQNMLLVFCYTFTCWMSFNTQQFTKFVLFVFNLFWIRNWSHATHLVLLLVVGATIFKKAQGSIVIFIIIFTVRKYNPSGVQRFNRKSRKVGTNVVHPSNLCSELLTNCHVERDHWSAMHQCWDSPVQEARLSKSLASPEFRELLLLKWQADALHTPKVLTAIASKM